MMKAAQLRQAILQAAVQGKLVSQNPHDEPASALLDRIRAEKTKLIKSGIIKKEKPLSSIAEDEIPYDLPEGWSWTKLGEITQKVHYGYTASAAPKGNVKLLRITDIQNNKVHWQNVPYCTVESNRLNDYQLNNQDILIARTGGTIGKTYLVADISHTAVFASYLIRVVPFSFYDIKYLKFYLESPLYWEQLREKSMGTGQPNVNGVSLSNLIMPLPPLTEQQRIVTKVEGLMAMCDELESAEKERDALDEHFIEHLPKSILQVAVQGKLVTQNIHDEPASVLLERIRAEKAKLIKAGKLKKEKPLPPITEDEIPYDLPESWVWSKFGNLILCNIGGGTPSKQNSGFWDGGIPWASVKDLQGDVLESTKDYISELGLANSSSNIVPANTIILCTRMGLGKIAVNKIPMAINQDLRAIFLPKDFINQQYFINYYKTLNIIGGGMTVKGISIDELHNMLFPLPPLAEQHRIVAKVDELMALCGELKTVENAIDASEPKQATIIPLGRAQENEPLQMAARGTASKKSDKHQKAIDDMFNDD